MASRSQSLKSRNKTYVRRESRITRAQQRALSEFSERYVLQDIESVIKLDELFPGLNRYALEIGFGDGEALIELAAANPDTGFIGVEVYRPGVGRCLLALDKANIDNVRVCMFDARDVLGGFIPEQSLSEIFILFSDPWPKKRHHKRRLVNSEFIQLCAACLKTEGRMIFATDAQDYAQQVLNQLEANSEFRNLAGPTGFYDGEPLRPMTRFERKALARGDQIYDLVFCRSER